MTENTAPTNEETTATENSSTVSPVVALWQAVSSATTAQGLAVRQAVINQLTEKEIGKRTEAVLTLMAKFDEKTKELKKSEKSLAQVEFDSEGKETRRYYTADGNKILKELREGLDNISKALTNFFDKNDTSKLYELANRK